MATATQRNLLSRQDYDVASGIAKLIKDYTACHVTKKEIEPFILALRQTVGLLRTFAISKPHNKSYREAFDAVSQAWEPINTLD